MEWNQFSTIFEEKCLFDLSKPVVIGVSGGPDSLCLLDLMRKTGIPIIVGHLNHGLREEAEAEAEKVKKQCEDLQIPCYFKRINVLKEAITHHYSIEEAGRIARYKFLFALAHEHAAQAVVVAHNSDDQVETILMHLIRGSGATGLTGMEYRQLPNEWSDKIPLTRPLLGVEKQEVLTYCETNALSPSFDKTNQSKTYYRNRLRLELIPFLERYNPKIKKRLVCMADVIREEDDFLTQVTLKTLESIVTAQGESYYVINRSALNAVHQAVRRRAFYALMRRLKPETPNISFEVIESAVQFAQKPTARGKKTLAAGLEVSNYLKDSILLVNAQGSLDDLWPQLQSSAKLSLAQHTPIHLNSHWQMEITDAMSGAEDNPWQARLDTINISELTVSNFIPGDRFTPFGLGGKSMKLGDYWTNAGLPARGRAHWPLVRSGDEIVWVPGFTINDKYKITDETQNKITLRLTKTG